MNIEKAKRVAAAVYRDIEPYCDRIVVAGSVRRLKEDQIKDIEFVAIPRYEMQPDIFMNMKPTGKNLLFAYLRGKYNVITGGKDGQKKAVFSVNGIKIEIYCATEENFGYILAIRTGPWNFSKLLVTKMKQRGYHPKDGVVWRGRHVVPAPTEQVAFRMAGIRYLDPDLRC